MRLQRNLYRLVSNSLLRQTLQRSWIDFALSSDYTSALQSKLTSDTCRLDTLRSFLAFYLDDLVVLNSDRNWLNEGIKFVDQTVLLLGFAVNEEKYKLIPTRLIEFLDASVNWTDIAFS